MNKNESREEVRESNLCVVAEEEARRQAILGIQQYSGGKRRLLQHRVGLRGPEGGLVVGAQLVQGVHLACASPKSKPYVRYMGKCQYTQGADESTHGRVNPGRAQ